MLKRSYILAGVAAGAVAIFGAWHFLNPSRTSSPATDAPAAGDAQTTGGLLAVAPEQATRLGIRLTPAAAAVEVPLAVVPATIEPPANARVAVAATFPGVVTRTLVVEGDAVRQGQPLAMVSSREVLTMAADLTRANARLRVAQANADRLAQLSREGIIAAARVDEAQAIAAEARADVSEKTRILRTVNGQGGTGVYVLTAPIAGRVTAAEVRAGEPLDGATAPYVIDAANRYEVIGQAPERLAGALRPGMGVHIAPDVAGRVVAVGSTIDPVTRSISVKAEIPAAPGVIAGRATSLTIFGPAPAGAVSAPSSAVAVIDGKTVVFVAAKGGYAVREVKDGGSAAGRTVLLSGVKAGEPVVVAGTSALKALALSR